MDPFFNEQNNVNIFNDEKVVVFCERSGRRYNTYIVGWNAKEEEQKKTLEILKKTFGCGGAIKNINYEGKEIQSLNLQGNFVIKTGEYMKTLKLQNLIIKELIN
jgi:translation initiation factor 1 (eIF-1/SUI1)